MITQSDCLGFLSPDACFLIGLSRQARCSHGRCACEGGRMRNTLAEEDLQWAVDGQKKAQAIFNALQHSLTEKVNQRNACLPLVAEVLDNEIKALQEDCDRAKIRLKNANDRLNKSTQNMAKNKKP